MLRLLSPAESRRSEDPAKIAALPASLEGQASRSDKVGANYSNGSCSDASVSSDLEALIPTACKQTPLHDSFEEEERVQWEPLGADKFAKHKNPPRYTWISFYSLDPLENSPYLFSSLIEIASES